VKNPVILIAGPSASGKSTLAAAVAAQAGFPCLALDDVFIRGAKAYVDRPEGRIRTFDRPELYNGARLAAQISNRTCGMVAEGFGLFAYRQMLGFAALRYYLDVPFALCAERRRARRPRRPSDRSFEAIGEEENASFVLPQRGIAGVRVMDGQKQIAELAAAIIADLATVS
jgi:shikimate kinase